MTGKVYGGTGAVVFVEPTEAQLEMLQAMSHTGATFGEIAERLRVRVALLNWWARSCDEAGDALRVARDIHELRAAMRIHDGASAHSSHNV